MAALDADVEVRMHVRLRCRPVPPGGRHSGQRQPPRCGEQAIPQSFARFGCRVGRRLGGGLAVLQAPDLGQLDQRPASRVVVAPLERGYERLAAPAGVVEPADTYLGERDPQQQRRHRQARPQGGGHLEPGAHPLQASFRSPLVHVQGAQLAVRQREVERSLGGPQRPLEVLARKLEVAVGGSHLAEGDPAGGGTVADVLGKFDRLREQRGGAGVVALEEVSEGE